MIYSVVTSVPDPKRDGNQAPAVGEITVKSARDGYLPLPQFLKMVGTNPLHSLAYHTPVFVLGEVVILDQHGQEVCGRRRDAVSWADIRLEAFDTIEEAVERAVEVTEAAEKADV